MNRAHLLLSHPAHFIALGFGAGLSPVAPGTVGIPCLQAYDERA